jgi:transcriptional regulator with XRE-family HTH domain
MYNPVRITEREVRVAQFSQERLKDIRVQRGLSQRDIPGVGQDTVWAIEAGHQKPRPSTLRKLAEALDVEVSTFFDEATVPLGEASLALVRAWLLEQTEGRHAYRAGSPVREVVGRRSLEELRDLFDDLEMERRLIEDEFQREFGYPVNTRVQPPLTEGFYAELKAAWHNGGGWYREIDARRQALREQRTEATSDDVRLVAVF